MLNVIRDILDKYVKDIDAGNSNLTEEEQTKILSLLSSISDPYISKYQAYQFLNISRAKFDNLVKEGKLPKGIKRSGFNELAWKKVDLIKYITRH